MKIQRLSYVIMYMILAGTTTVSGQNALPVTGGNATGSVGSVSYTVGQPVYTTNSSASGSIAHGVQQAYTISVISSQINTDRIRCSVYPNPTADFLQLDVEGVNLAGLHYGLTDMTGRRCAHGEAFRGITQIDLANLAQASYYLTVYDEKHELISFQIVKN